MGEVEEGLDLLADALDLVQRSRQHEFEAELYRLRGELLLVRGAAGAASPAEASFRQAIEVARKQQARSWELRATTSLSRLLRAGGRSDEARRLLANIYDWFSEGLDTPDLRAARALLGELSSAVGLVDGPGRSS